MASRNRYHPLIARRAMKKLREDPDDTAQAIRVIGALSGNSGERLFERFKSTSGGQKILRERQDLFELMRDTERLRAMPEGSLGRAIGDWYAVEEISAQGLADASEAAFSEGGPPRRETPDDDADLFGTRLRDLHDIFHVLAGYGRDLRGEAAVLAFTVPQTRNPGVAYMVWSFLRGAGWFSDEGKLIRRAFQRGRRSEWLVDQDWEALFEQPIDEVREKLGVGAPPEYEPLRSEGAPVLT
jgi:ubiquinone biosynthesis protein COQ4